MSTVAEVKLWGRTIGAVALEADADVASFQYDPAFARSHIEIAPFTMPLSDRVFSFPSLSHETFHGLPGLLSDSIPDRFGNALINAWLASQGRSPESFNAVERLCYTGTRGMGALEFFPAIGPTATKNDRVQIDKLVELASEILTHRTNLKMRVRNDNETKVMQEILRIGTSAGGARAKAVIAWNPKTNEVRSGQVKADKGFEYWLLKFDGVRGNRDKELDAPTGYGAVEYAYSRMAKDAGISMSECHLFAEGARRHFMTRRFDRTGTGEKLHLQSLGALTHLDFNQAGTHGYEQALMTIRQLGLPMSAIEEQFRRMTFNIVARNQDDHVKNIAFLMDKSGHWSLAPAFDVTYSFQPDGRWTSTHQMSINGKRDNFAIADFSACAKSASMKRGRARTIVSEVLAVVSKWKTYADEAGVNPAHRDQIHRTLRLHLS